ncbi:hypothetical protein RJ640_006082 [Escallonia rubra]|uniref:Leucine-rich repeat-containing N-terminal plant-type domain-containing protein n=1 Tax=Escallonia rubra TaxID=112253 RepID=A0AA88RTV3_9ASTE|nr:hypothetical protein RJ640_006082 [Escallonia rubra]
MVIGGVKRTRYRNFAKPLQSDWPHPTCPGGQWHGRELKFKFSISDPFKGGKELDCTPSNALQSALGYLYTGTHQRRASECDLQCLYSDMLETILDFLVKASVTAAGSGEGPPRSGGWGLKGWVKGMKDRAVGAVLDAGTRQPCMEAGDSRPIMSARVPIVKVVDSGTGIECDISVENRDGILKSHIVHMISSIDGRGSVGAAGFTNETDRQALLAFKDLIQEDPFAVLSSWNDSLHFCEWKGVTCGHQHQRVTAVELMSQNLVGSLSPQIGRLTFLRKIYLDSNGFHGTIPPDIGQLFRLQSLSLGLQNRDKDPI